MKRAYLLVLAVLVLSSLQAQSQPLPQPLRVMSFNVRCLAPEDNFRDLWWLRKDDLAKVILENNPELIGMQEVYTLQAHGLEKYLKDYSWFGPPRDDGKNKGERNPIFYKKDRLELLEQNTFWLSETPETPGSQSWDSACKRIVTWGKFRDKATGKIFFQFNTHFDHKGPQAREMSAKLLVARVKQIAGATPFFVTGDFNTTDRSVPYQTITSRMPDARELCASPRGPRNTAWTFKPGVPPDQRIDYIFVSRGTSVPLYAALDQTYHNGRKPSDHVPIMALLLLP